MKRRLALIFTIALGLLLPTFTSQGQKTEKGVACFPCPPVCSETARIRCEESGGWMDEACQCNY
jgi:hypothetical protein